MSRFPLITRLGALAVVAALALSPATAQTPRPEDTPLKIVPAATVNEPLFLLYAVDDVYRSVPGSGADQTTLQNWLIDSKLTMRRLARQVADHKLDGRLAQVLRDCQEMLGAIENYVAAQGRIDRAAVARQSQDNFNSGFAAGQTGTRMYQAAKARGQSDDDALAGAVLVGGLKFLIDGYNAAQERDAARRAAIAAAQRELASTADDVRRRTGRAAQDLTTQERWSPGEADPSDTLTVADWARRQPRNPFAQAALVAASWHTSASAADRMASSRHLLAAARLVPAGDTYDGYRLRFVRLAADIAGSAARKDQYARGLAATPSAYGPDAVQLWRTVSLLNGGRLTEDERYDLWQCLACCGRLYDARQIADQLLGWASQHQNANYVYNYVCLCGVSGGDLNIDLKNLGVAFAYGMTDVALVRRDPDLARLRRERSKDFEELLKVKADYRLVYGVFNDDITMTNQSRFPLTNVVVDVEIKKGTQTWRRRLTVGYLAPGQTYKWADVVSIPGSHCDVWYANLSCSQKP